MQFLREVLLNLKNSIGWKTARKIIVFSVDDYGNVRINSKEARANMDAAGMKIYSRFDLFDTLETKKDLAELYTVLESVKDKNGRHPVFTTFAMPCNVNFEKMEREGFQHFHYEMLPETFEKMAKQDPAAYLGAWDLLKEGIAKGLLKPQFHGREHLNLSIFRDKLQKRDKELLTALKNKSYTSISDDEYPTMSSTAAFDFWDVKENENLILLIEDGLRQFHKVYGYKNTYFTPPVYNIHRSLFPVLKEYGIEFMDLGLVRKEHQGFNKYKTSLNYSGKKTKNGPTIMVRNVVFEPTEERGIDWSDFAMHQIEAAFRWRKPAVISSHRVNFCGYIDSQNREKGLLELKKLLDKVVKRWPDVEFMSADELGECLKIENK